MPRTNNRSNGGFIATTAIILLVTGSIAFILATMTTAVMYADGIGRREARIQKSLNKHACEESRALAATKDYLEKILPTFPEFDCH